MDEYMSRLSKDNAVVINGSQTVYQGRQFDFTVDEITLPNGVRTEVALVRHPGSTAIASACWN